MAHNPANPAKPVYFNGGRERLLRGERWVLVGLERFTAGYFAHWFCGRLGHSYEPIEARVNPQTHHRRNAILP